MADDNKPILCKKCGNDKFFIKESLLVASPLDVLNVETVIYLVGESAQEIFLSY